MATTTTSQSPFSSPSTALQLTQQTSNFLSSLPTAASSFLASFFSTETPDTYANLTNHFYACLSTSDDESAHLCLEKLSARFGPDDHRIMAMRGMYQEAVAKDDAELKRVLGEYNKILADNPMNVPVHKRRITLIKTLGGPADAITGLTDFLEAWPTDVEAWCELSELYVQVGQLDKAVWCAEEALLGVPNSWALMGRVGELELLAGKEGEAVKRFARTVELCEGYLRGWYGLKIAVGKCLEARGEVDGLDRSKLQALNDLATKKLKDIIRERNTAGIQDTEHAELIAAQALLDRTAP